MAVDGRSFQPHSLKKTTKVVGKGEFIIAVCGLIHGHVYGLLSGLVGAGAEVGYVYEEDDTLYESFHDIYPTAMRVVSIETLFSINDIILAESFSKRLCLVIELLRVLETFNSGKISREKIEKSPKVTINSKRENPEFFLI